MEQPYVLAESSTPRQLSPAAVHSIAARLASDLQLTVPGNMTKAGTEEPTAAKKRQYLEALLLRDPGVFLERHGDLLTRDERGEFQGLRGDYEVDFYLKVLEDRADSAVQSTLVKNRRLAQLNRLIADGEFFSDEAMRGRAPLLHHQYVGQYRPASEDTSAEGLSGTLSDNILRQHDAAQHAQRVAAEQAQQDMVEEESESEESESEESRESSSDSETGAKHSGRTDGGQQDKLEGTGRGRKAGEKMPERAAASSASDRMDTEPADAGRAVHRPSTSSAAPATMRPSMGPSGAGAAKAGLSSGQSVWEALGERAAGAHPGRRASVDEAGAGRSIDAAGIGKEAERAEDGDQIEDPARSDYVHIPDEERAQLADDFMELMKSRFLAGDDAGAGVDYPSIDRDTSLDDDWLETRARDAEERYFDAD